jgi:acetate---CoA ligase (ADP-forming)
MIVGVTHDPAFGPLVLVGLGGTMVEVLGDVAVRITSDSTAPWWPMCASGCLAQSDWMRRPEMRAGTIRR